MKRFAAALLAIACFAAHAEEVTPERTTWTKVSYATLTTLRVIDYGQTRWIAQHPNDVKEANPFLGSHPSIKQVNTYFASVILIDALMYAYAPERTAQNYFTGMSIVTGLAVTSNAVRFNVKISF